MTPQEIISKILEDIVAENNFTTEEQLATHLGTSTVSIWRWRHGFLDKSTKILVPILWQRIAAAEPVEV